MTGFDGIFALLKIVRADLSVKWKKIHDKDSSLSEADVAYLNAVKGGFAPQFAYAA